ncbi:MAG TPA: hypothetical protein DCW31_11820, partial [Lactobacillus sp.]|nr:hypothetical protein [Lactobacillus sp.]
ADHSTYLENKQHLQQVTSVEPEMTLSDIDELLQTSWQEHVEVTVQLNIVDNNIYVPVNTGTVIGFNNDHTYLQLKDGSLRTIQIQDIRNVSITNINNEKWWSHGNSL